MNTNRQICSLLGVDGELTNEHLYVLISIVQALAVPSEDAVKDTKAEQEVIGNG